MTETIEAPAINATIITATTTNAATPATTTLAQRVVKIQFHLQNIGNSIIIIGQELIECKKEVGHGNWANWLKDNFNLKKSTAANFMAIANRFSNFQTSGNFSQSQLVEMLALPEGEEEKFIEEKAAEGKPVEKMTVKETRAEIKKYKDALKKTEAELQRLQKYHEETVTQQEEFKALKAREEAALRKTNEKLQADLRQAQKDSGRLQAKFDAADKLAYQYHVERDSLQKKLENQKPVTVEPADYQQLKKTQIELQNKINALQKKLSEQTTVEVVPPADYEDTKKELARLQKNYTEISLTMEIAQKLDAIATLIQDVMTSQSENGVEEYAKLKPERFDSMCANFADFLDFYKKG